MEKVYIIMPTYNNGNEIERAIKSILCQSYREWNLIIINDASTDNTENICKRYAQKDRRIQMISNIRNIGSAASRNKGLECARGGTAQTGI